MARVTVEDCLEKIPNRFAVAMLAVKRARQLQRGEKSLLSDRYDNKPCVMALREVAEGLIYTEYTSEAQTKREGRPRRRGRRRRRY